MRDDTPAPKDIGLDSAALQAIARRIEQPIVLIGLMGTGKSTVGRKLASMLGKDFVDADHAIEDAAQLTIAEIFEQYGEDYFRDGERRVIARLMDEHDGVIATGGGAFVNDETRALILDRAISVWIDCDIDVLVERTSRKDTRPLLRNGNPHEILTRLHKEREPFYSQAPIRVGSENGPHHETAIAIIEAIDRWL
ncbi:shikimate kinase [Pontixanthobacter aestiaquae]|uniref:Shikimate kinase n=1 Tax=Pontixanthobacter aestiaquae TaxID=1509367 RepID=A0A844Z961_9SPHN|nr:shikimate kinase [Pontixanthobacter aestiaquae]MDN3645623.1 shikimate kinase [Pontixanthobacter aestiaquae]MXO83380.1 shikimate kinase [Pontixanthobacter aestiaquae]